MKKLLVVATVVAMWAMGAAAQTGGVTSVQDIVFPLSVAASPTCDVDGTPDPCTGECVAYAGDMQMQTTTFFDENGGLHTRIKQLQSNVVGTGQTSLKEYRIISSGNSVEDVSNDGLPAEVTLISRFRMLGEGPLPNEMILITFHVTINASGNVTSSVDRYDLKCTGK